MFVRLKQSWLVWLLLLGLVLVNGLLAAPAVAHAGHHAKHDAGTHSTGLCAWQCAAGQTAEDAAPLSMLVVAVTAPAFLPEIHISCKPFVVRTASRGPPSVPPSL
ncbi:MAG: hypothetical protein RI101_13365 [Nitrospira sp.]|jgi:hypothetical protein|nr:hypothetical protein [Nitrospira sp.]